MNGWKRRAAVVAAAAGVCAGQVLAQTDSKGKQPANQPGGQPAGQPGGQPGGKPATTQPGTQPGGKAAKLPEPREPGPYIRLSDPNDFILNVNVQVRPDRSSDWTSPDGGKTKQPDVRSMRYKKLAMVWAIPPSTASAMPSSDSIRGFLEVDDRRVTEKHELIQLQASSTPQNPVYYHSGAHLIRFNHEDAAEVTCREIEMEFEMKWRCSATRFDDAAAANVPWPTGPWPAVAASTLMPQLFINYERTRGPNGQPVNLEYAKDIQSTVDQWTNKNPRSATPVMLAKYFAGQVAGMVQPTGNGLSYLNTGQVQGFDLQAPVTTLRSGRGSEFDMANLLCALYRAAGLPSRIVVGYRKVKDGDGRGIDVLRKGSDAKPEPIAWVEFYLYDEKGNTANWVPVDVVGLRKKTGGRPPALDKPWPYFGTIEEMNGYVPMALGYHPPTTVESYGAPGLWGWLMTPTPPGRAFQALTFRVSSASKRGDDQPMEDDSKNKQQKPKTKKP